MGGGSLGLGRFGRALWELGSKASWSAALSGGRFPSSPPGGAGAHTPLQEGPCLTLRREQAFPRGHWPCAHRGLREQHPLLAFIHEGDRPREAGASPIPAPQAKPFFFRTGCLPLPLPLGVLKRRGRDQTWCPGVPLSQEAGACQGRLLEPRTPGAGRAQEVAVFLGLTRIQNPKEHGRILNEPCQTVASALPLPQPQ